MIDRLSNVAVSITNAATIIIQSMFPALIREGFDASIRSKLDPISQACWCNRSPDLILCVLRLCVLRPCVLRLCSCVWNAKFLPVCCLEAILAVPIRLCEMILIRLVVLRIRNPCFLIKSPNQLSTVGWRKRSLTLHDTTIPVVYYAHTASLSCSASFETIAAAGDAGSGFFWLPGMCVLFRKGFEFQAATLIESTVSLEAEECKANHCRVPLSPLMERNCMPFLLQLKDKVWRLRLTICISSAGSFRLLVFVICCCCCFF